MIVLFDIANNFMLFKSHPKVRQNRGTFKQTPWHRRHHLKEIPSSTYSSKVDIPMGSVHQITVSIHSIVVTSKPRYCSLLVTGILSKHQRLKYFISRVSRPKGLNTRLPRGSTQTSSCSIHSSKCIQHSTTRV